MTVELKTKIWLEEEGKKIFGDGPCDILQRVDRNLSLRQSAAEIKMSYSQAWKLINMIEENLGFSVLDRQTGGKGGGRSTLTVEAARLTEAYRLFREEAEVALQSLCEKHLAEFIKVR